MVIEESKRIASDVFEKNEIETYNVLIKATDKVFDQIVRRKNFNILPNVLRASQFIKQEKDKGTN